MLAVSYPRGGFVICCYRDNPEASDKHFQIYICRHSAQNTVQSDVYSNYTAVLKPVWVF